MTSKFLVYGLVDPRDGQLRYVGKSCSGLWRPTEEFNRALKGQEGANHRVNWIKNMHSSGCRYSVVVFQELESNEILSQAEVFWIAYFRGLGCKLTNMTVGGEGVVYSGVHRRGYHLSDATRAKMRAKRLSDKTKALIGAWSRGKKRTERTKHLIQMSQPHRRSVVDQNGVVYPTISDAARCLGLDRSNISAMLHGRLKSIGGYIFRVSNG